MDALVTLHTGHPYDEVICSIRSGDPRGAAAGLILLPGKHDRWRICRRDLVGFQLVIFVVKTNVRSLAGVVRNS